MFYFQVLFFFVVNYFYSERNKEGPNFFPGEKVFKFFSASYWIVVITVMRFSEPVPLMVSSHELLMFLTCKNEGLAETKTIFHLRYLATIFTLEL
jgi:hypothetical protein